MVGTVDLLSQVGEPQSEIAPRQGFNAMACGNCKGTCCMRHCEASVFPHRGVWHAGWHNGLADSTGQCCAQGVPLRCLRRVPTELKKAIMAARLDKKLTQAQLGQLINEKPNVIQVSDACCYATVHGAARFLNPATLCQGMCSVRHEWPCWRAHGWLQWCCMLEEQGYRNPRLLPVLVLQEYENGKAIPAPAVLSKLSRVLGVQLSVKKK